MAEKQLQEKKQTQLNEGDWLNDELERAESSSTYTGEKLPSMKFIQDKVMEIDVDFSKPFFKWNDKNLNGKDVCKAVVPVVYLGERKAWWLNVMNPIYREILRLGKDGKTKVKIMQTGTGANTRYIRTKD